MTTFSPAPKPRSLPKPPKGLKKINRARKKLDDERVYGSKARRKWVNLRECSACHVWGFSQNAHVLGNDGAGRKAGYKTISALCGPRPEGDSIYQGCHSMFDTAPEKFRERFPSFDAKREAAATERAWRKFLRGEPAA